MPKTGKNSNHSGNNSFYYNRSNFYHAHSTEFYRVLGRTTKRVYTL